MDDEEEEMEKTDSVEENRLANIVADGGLVGVLVEEVF